MHFLEIAFNFSYRTAPNLLPPPPPNLYTPLNSGQYSKLKSQNL